MNPLNSVGDLIAAGAHWIADAFQRAGRGIRAYTTRLQERFGARLTAPRTAIRQTWDITAQARAAAQLMEAGIEPPFASIPLFPGLGLSQQFGVMGTVDMSDPTLGEPGQPLSTTLPFQVESDKIPTLQSIEQGIGGAIEDEGTYESRRRQIKASKRRQRAQFIRSRGGNIEYAITPHFLFRVR